MKKGIAILGSTGSIGKQTLEVVSIFPSSLTVVALAAKDEVDLIVEQIKKFSPKIVSVATAEVKQQVEAKLGASKVQIMVGEEGLLKVATEPTAKMVVVAIPGSLCLVPTLEAVKSKKDLALATKEVLVVAGDLFMQEVKAAGVKVFPIDSEHSAIVQCLKGEDPKTIKKIVLTASGGPFLKTPIEKFAQMTAKDALKHPTWKMGPKITIDSSTLMNKGFEVMEAHYLFGLDYSKIEVLVHPQSIIHSMVEFVDGSVKAQLGAADMRVPIQYALLEEKRSANHWPSLNFAKLTQMTFQEPDKQKFPCLQYAYDAGKVGGTLPAVLNAANEAAIKLFLRGKLNFAQLPQRINEIMTRHQNKKTPTLADILEADNWARAEVN
ncbi:1-deoxy-D-xylulose-5-phosphate reductoisomerase [candidate division WOR-1 bacterium RIFOXYB2_FULL_42_35]|uniref:1-deoxy-D-xylulose 5-phosphate reductoisomerase n=1 Tax=candidate division WOR-1 bacterium RIFOXYC2_FULL_41_25 TaxID=1802586 RepID=A0A1F4TRA2_UNCSA|nr:MAG: 1-deoxy-D-xylulose-5-phosphate reductoisomerase [candidate division WOR-1 bacterium RIFOXYA2_FULL_41_14]OGC25832.1 MAG: 1-deoxy-D-xylulose-5-phosphate reductoisomerase [candidate division WOR-1 bacterium RIFOXYB2_FULL_42_35]OGC35272.1 MAG: 1-deoxy-D-xylulose-5-phosphate reductoisomerase [candidate division WOR-1 bacterium RIFOXYC2_FULL_41_25]OGC41644.1 MAG: 1-deoxy-D-xylulose-5-phosphate reductoisomerase [candidate division WOR-1 bacterium RIFOXYD2_FULL_41_8]